MRVVLICSNHMLGRLMLPSLGRLGAKFYLICDERAEHLRLSRHCRGVLLSSSDLATERSERVIAAINQLARAEPIDCVLASDVDALVLLSGIRARIECPTFPMAPRDTLARLSNKWLFHNLCRNCDVDVPPTLFYPNKYRIDTAEIAATMGFPVVVKPSREAESSRVVVARDATTLESSIIRNDDYRCEEVLVQQFADGQSAGFGGLAIKGKLQRWSTFLLHDDETVQFTPLPQLVSAAQRLIAAENFTGVISFDARIDRASETIRLLECHPRIFVQIRASRLCGLDFIGAALRPHAGAMRGPESLAKGNYLPPGSLLSWRGWRQVVAGRWSMRSGLSAVAEMLSDPLPLLAELDRRGAVQGATRPGSTVRAPASTVSG